MYHVYRKIIENPYVDQFAIGDILYNSASYNEAPPVRSFINRETLAALLQVRWSQLVSIFLGSYVDMHN